MLDNEVEKPTVSVIVITYNSAAYVIETLNSIKDQDYEAIELVITDDCSADHTVELVKEWLKEEQNTSSFRRVQLVVNPHNLGVAGNCNAGLSATTGQWIKLIAGDDLLLPSCISSFMKAAALHPSAKLFVSKLNVFRDELHNHVYTWPNVPIADTLNVQLKYQLRGSYIKAPAVLMNASVLKDFGGFDERISFLEDDPMWLKFLQHGHPFVYIPEVLVAYRLHELSISNGTGTKFISVLFFNSLKKYKEEMALPLLKAKGMWLWYFLVRLELNTMQQIVDDGNHCPLSLKQKLIFRVISVLRERAKQFNL